MKSIALKTTKSGTFTLCALVNDDLKIVEYVVAYFYKPELNFGNQWACGHYFDNLEDAISLLRQLDNRPNIFRLEEICSQALHWIEDEYDDFFDFENNYDLCLDENELLFFGLDKYIDC